jgi:hypothetical protein
MGFQPFSNGFVNMRYGRVMKIIWGINTVFSTSFVQNCKCAGKLVEVSNIIFSLTLGQTSFKHTWN